MLSAEQQNVLAQLDIPQWQERHIVKQKVFALSQADYAQREAALAPLLANIGFFMGVSDLRFVEEGKVQSHQDLLFDASLLPFTLQEVMAQPQLKRDVLMALRESACLDV